MAIRRHLVRVSVASALGLATVVGGAIGTAQAVTCQAHQTPSKTANWSSNCTTSTSANATSDLTTQIQWVLNALGYNVGTIDGVYGTNTRAAVVAFQKASFPSSPSQWDGIVGPNTWAKLATKIQWSIETSSYIDFAVPGDAVQARLYRTGSHEGDWYTLEHETCTPFGASGDVPMDSTRNCT